MAIATGRAVIAGLQIGLHAAQLWNEFNAELLRRQQQRDAEGKSLTLQEVQQMLADTRARIDGNHAKLVSLAAEQDALTAQALGN